MPDPIQGFLLVLRVDEGEDPEEVARTVLAHINERAAEEHLPPLVPFEIGGVYYDEDGDPVVDLRVTPITELIRLALTIQETAQNN